jgi:hypothetical protein
MDWLTKEEIRDLMEKRDFSCVSIYMPTHRTAPKTRQDPIRFKNLLRQAEERLVGAGLRRSEAKALSGIAQDLLKDRLFWQYQSDGFAAFISSHWFRYYRLPESFDELLVVTDRFHIKPLIRLLANDGRFYILALSRNEVKLFQCTRNNVTEIELEGVPASLAEALKLDDPSKQLQLHTATPRAMGDRAAVFHGHGAGRDQDKENILKFFKQIDPGIRKVTMRDPGPLVLSGVDYLFSIYREANSHPLLMDAGISGSPGMLKPDVLQKAGWDITEPYFLKARADAIERYNRLCGTGMTSTDVETIALAAYRGRVDLIFVAVGIQQWGAFDRETESVRLHRERKAEDEDILDFAAVHTAIREGTVHALLPEEMPARTNLAAIFRY